MKTRDGNRQKQELRPVTLANRKEGRMNHTRYLTLIAIGILAVAGGAYASGIWIDGQVYPTGYGNFVQVQTAGAPWGSYATVHWVDPMGGPDVMLDGNWLDPAGGTMLFVPPHVTNPRIDIHAMDGTLLAATYVGGVDFD